MELHAKTHARELQVLVAELAKAQEVHLNKMQMLEASHNQTLTMKAEQYHDLAKQHTLAEQSIGSLETCCQDLMERNKALEGEVKTSRQFAEDIRRELREPFVVPALWDGLKLLSSLPPQL